jgi:endoplasmic reticulum chaperone BiP
MRVSILVALLLASSAFASKQTHECPIIGIDLGTTYSCVGVLKNGRVEIIPNELGSRITPSVVAFTDEERLIGEAAKNQASTNPTRTIYDVKRLIGRGFADQDLQNDKKFLPYNIINKSGKPHIEVTSGGKTTTYVPEQISAMVLGKMKQIAENYLGMEITTAVVTVPAYFNDAQRKATMDAGQIAGLTVARIINEPTAAAIAYGLDKKSKDSNILVYDLGGGTFDVSILNIDNGHFEVSATSGDTHLGGADFDQRVMDEMYKTFKRKTGKDASSDKRAQQKLKREVENAKRALSTTHEVTIDIENFFDGVDLNEKLTRSKFESLNKDLFQKTLDPVRIALEDSGLKKTQIDEIVLVGGSTRIPKIQELIKDYFDGKEPAKNINPDEAVAYGAAVQGALICGDASVGAKNMIIIDMTPLTLGIELVGGVMGKVVPRGTSIPTKKSETFTTESDNQTQLEVAIYEGERPLVKANHLLGRFTLKGIKPRPRGEPQIVVTFNIDENSIITVTAEEEGSDVKGEITITNDKGRLTQEQIESKSSKIYIFNKTRDGY